MLKVFLVPDRFAHYRYSIFNKIAGQYELDIYAPKEKDFSGIKVADYNDKLDLFKWVGIKSFFFKKVCFWHTHIISAALLRKYDVYVFWGDSWNVSTWISAVICRLHGKKVVFWTHGLYGSESRLRLIYRVCFYRLSNNMLLYGNHAKKELLKYGFEKGKLHVINNSLDFDLQDENYKKYSVIEKEKKARRNMVFIGRLEANKKLDLLLKALFRINNEQSDCDKIYLSVLGDGAQMPFLKKLCNKLDISSYVSFYGACYDQHVIAPIVINSDICVSPGNVGLTAMQSLVYGTPVITHDDATQQMPEYESVIEGKSGTLYKNNSEKSLVEAIYRCFKFIDEGIINKKTCREVIVKYYNPNYQLKIFNEMINSL